jgi:hypothetical protein
MTGANVYNPGGGFKLGTMMRKWVRLSMVVGCLLAQIVLITPAAGQQEPTAVDEIIANSEAIVDYPNDVTFRLELAADTTVVDAVLTYGVEQHSCLDAVVQVPVEFTGSIIEWTWIMIRSGNPPPGVAMWWEWRLTDAQGNEYSTPRQELTFTDDRFQWRTLEAEGIRLYWYRGDEVGPTLLDAAVGGLDRLQNEMGIELLDDVKLFIYGSSADMREAVLYIQDWAGGVAFSEYNVILIGVPPDIAEDWGRSTVRHELAHLVVGQFGQSCVGGSRPTWLNEGLAVFAEGELQADFAEALDSAFEDNSFEPVRSLAGAFPTDEEVANLAYAQSYSVVAFMLSEYGQEKMQELLLTLAQGEGYDEALQQVYGFNVDGLEVAWRQAIGAAERLISPTPTPILAANIPTVAPLGVPQNMPTPPSAAEPPPEISTQSPGFCGLGMVPLLFMGLVGRFTYHRRKRSR